MLFNEITDRFDRNWRNPMKLSVLMKRVIAVLCALLVFAAPTALAEKQVNLPLKITSSGLTYPGTLEAGSSFSLKGTVNSSYGTITSIKGTVVNRTTGKTALTATVYPNSRTVNLQKTLNTKLSFGKLAAGSYRLKIEATAKSGSKKVTKVIMNRNFTVTAKKLNITISNAVYPTGGIHIGDKAALRGTIRTSQGKLTSVKASIINSAGKTVISSSYTPNAESFDLRYTVNQDLTFDILPAGKYTYKVVATAEYNGSKTTKTLVNAKFEVWGW